MIGYKKGRFTGKSSLQSRLLLIVLSALILVALFMTASTTYAIHLVNRQVSTAYKENVVMYLNWIESLFDGVERRLYGIADYESELRLIAADQKDNKTKLAQKRMMDFISSEAYSYPYMDGFFIFAPESNVYLERRSVSTPLSEKEAFCNDLFAYLKHQKDEMELGQWVPIRMGNSSCFFRVIQFENAFFGAWVSAERLLDTLGISEFQSNDYIFFVTQEGVPMTDQEAILTGGFDLNGNLDSCYFTKGYMAAGADYPKGSFRMLTLTEQQKILSGLNVLYFFAIAFCVLLLFLIPFIVSKIHRWIVEPVNKLVAAMDKLKNGDLGVKLEKAPVCNEFRILNDSFTNMAKEIKKLKLDIYEEKLLKQKTQLHYFQLQIHPHFFINSLNMIYNLAQVEKYELIQKLSLNLCEYYRFSIRNTGDFVTLREELNHVHRYLEIQKIRFGEHLQIRLETDPLLMEFQLPPLTIETFVENSVKYALNMEDPAEIEVSVKLSTKDTEQLLIRIADSGPGFSEERMEDILSGKPTLQRPGEGGHLGIYNVQQRLWLLYGEEAQLDITNRDPHGTLVEIFLPKIRKEAAHD